MAIDVSKSIFKNAQDLLGTSLSLLAIGKKYHAAHFAALCIEECSKCLMHIEGVKKVFEGKYRDHFKKEEMAGFFHYLAGMLSITYIMKFSLNSGLLGKEVANPKILLDELLESSGMKGIDSLTKCIQKYLEALIKHKGDSVTFTINEIRKNSVYVDVVNGLALTPKKRVKDKAIREIIDDARFAVSLLNMALYKNFSWIEFLETFPGKHKNPESEAKKFVQSLTKKMRNANL